jgi:ribonuclease HI
MADISSFPSASKVSPKASSKVSPKVSGESLPKIRIYTDGSCLGNPGAGGYGALLDYGDRRQELSGGYRLTTNNRMEILAAIVALRSLETASVVDLYTDSQYLVNTMTKGWAKRWQANNWQRNAKDKAENPDLWQELLELCKQHQVTFHWVRGHSGHPENEYCDRLAVKAAHGSNLPPDSGYKPKK